MSAAVRTDAPRRWGWVRWAVLAITVLFLLPVSIGYVAGHLEARGEKRPIGWAIAAMLIPLALTGGYLWRRAAPSAPGEGEQRAAKRSRAFWTVLGVQFVVGVVVGLAGARYFLEGGLPATLPPGLAVFLAVGTTLSLIGASIALYPRMDELEKQDNLWAGSAATSIVLTTYPASWLLWKGGWVAEPSHEILFAVLFVTMTATYLLRKYLHRS